MSNTKLYFPLLIHFNEPGMAFNNLCELEEMNGAFYTSNIKNAIKESMDKLGERGLADKIFGPIGEKVKTAILDVEEVNGELFGTVNFETEEPLTVRETALLQFWTWEMMSGKLSKEFEEQAIQVEDGELYVSLYNETYEWEAQTEEEFLNGMRDEKFELMYLFDKPVLFTNERLDYKKDYDGLYRYDLRHDDDCQGDICEVKNSVLVNHWGSILSKEKIEPREHNGQMVSTDEGIVVTEDDYGYIGTSYTIDEYKDNYDNIMAEDMEEDITLGPDMSM